MGPSVQTTTGERGLLHAPHHPHLRCLHATTHPPGSNPGTLWLREVTVADWVSCCVCVCVCVSVCHCSQDVVVPVYLSPHHFNTYGMVRSPLHPKAKVWADYALMRTDTHTGTASHTQSQGINGHVFCWRRVHRTRQGGSAPCSSLGASVVIGNSPQQMVCGLIVDLRAPDTAQESDRRYV